MVGTPRIMIANMRAKLAWIITSQVRTHNDVNQASRRDLEHVKVLQGNGVPKLMLAKQAMASLEAMLPIYFLDMQEATRKQMFVGSDAETNVFDM